MFPKIKITKTTGVNERQGGKQKDINIQVGTKKGITEYGRTVTKNGGKKTVENSVVRNLRSGSTTTKTKENGVKSKSYYADSDRNGGKTYKGTDKKTFDATKKLNKVVEKSGRAADVKRYAAENAQTFKNAAMEGVKSSATKIGRMEMLRKGSPKQRQVEERRKEMYNSMKMKNQTKP